MTRDDVISAAFFVWGRELYKTTSLAKLADALGVSKPALYRHFPGKDALLKAMETRFYDDYAAEMKPVLEGAVGIACWQERIFVMARFITAYFARHFDYFIYSLTHIHYKKEEKHRFFDDKEMQKRGIFFARLIQGMQADREYPPVMFLAGTTSFFDMALFHKNQVGHKNRFPLTAAQQRELLGKRLEYAPSEEDVQCFAEATVTRVRLGLCFDRELINSLPYEKLEALSVPEEPYSPDPLLKAVAEAMAEAGPYTSMETVAKRSGLSKSGLYAHFKSKRDMFSRFFMSEFDHIVAIVSARSGLTEGRAERLYLALHTIAVYLRARPEILIALEWVRIQRLNLDLSVPAELYSLFEGFTIGDMAVEKSPENTSQWILFLLVAVLMYRSEFAHGPEFNPEQCLDREPACGGNCPENGFSCFRDSEPGGKTGEFTSRSLRKLFKFITLGMEGLTEIGET
ncbi:MAG: TetR/AcrR family transcriptional regulator [Treponema sp.]|jgi:AcrR family transcriptional regulator|nr:TetR/AcrR family transcriptional regulator [Treponema sp.]